MSDDEWDVYVNWYDGVVDHVDAPSNHFVLMHHSYVMLQVYLRVFCPSRNG